ncbi:MAG: GreA/GreB family elongation factor [Chloroflexi bacterium]|nr:GreA/GreB family elongation factor [Chloroflexota bacterium]
MPDVSLTQAAQLFLSRLGDAARQELQGEVYRFIRWYGADRSLSDLRGHDISLYADTLGPATAEASRRADHVRSFLAFLKKEGLTETNLAPHLRLRKGTGTESVVGPVPETVELTPEGRAALGAELESLIAQRPAIADELRRAMVDKDFRENAPLDAAKERQAHVEGRIREIEATLKQAVIVENRGGAKVHLGCSVVLRNLANGAAVRYTVVGANEANAQEGKISSVSPVGRALIERSEGDEVEVQAPAGMIRFRIESVEG